MDLTTKNVFNFEEAVEYTGMKASYLYKLTSTGRIPHYKPYGKMIYFRREELEEFLTRKADKKQAKKG
jgi:excisionase family DNA binding protein